MRNSGESFCQQCVVDFAERGRDIVECDFSELFGVSEIVQGLDQLQWWWWCEDVVVVVVD